MCNVVLTPPNGIPPARCKCLRLDWEPSPCENTPYEQCSESSVLPSYWLAWLRTGFQAWILIILKQWLVQFLNKSSTKRGFDHVPYVLQSKRLQIVPWSIVRRAASLKGPAKPSCYIRIWSESASSHDCVISWLLDNSSILWVQIQEDHHRIIKLTSSSQTHTHTSYNSYTRDYLCRYLLRISRISFETIPSWFQQQLTSTNSLL